VSEKEVEIGVLSRFLCGFGVEGTRLFLDWTF